MAASSRCPQAPPIPLKFFGFASHPGEAEENFSPKGMTFSLPAKAREWTGDIKFCEFPRTSVEMRELVFSGSPQTLPLSQG